MALTDIAKNETRPMNGPEERKDGKPGEEPEDIELFTQWVDGTAGGKRVHITSSGIYHAADGMTVVTHDGPRKIEERYEIPPEVEKTKEAPESDPHRRRHTRPQKGIRPRDSRGPQDRRRSGRGHPRRP